jgi:hypothetical protein
VEEVTIEDPVPSCAVEGKASNACDVPALPGSRAAAHRVLVLRLV